MRETVDLPVAIEPVRAIIIIVGEWEGGGLRGGVSKVDWMRCVWLGEGVVMRSLSF